MKKIVFFIISVLFFASCGNFCSKDNTERAFEQISYLDSLYNVQYSALKENFNMENAFKYMREASNLCDELCVIGKKYYKDTEIYSKVFDLVHDIMNNQLDVIKEFNKDVDNVFLVNNLMDIYKEEYNKASVADSIVMEDVNKLTYKTFGVKVF